MVAFCVDSWVVGIVLCNQDISLTKIIISDNYRASVKTEEKGRKGSMASIWIPRLNI